MAEYKHSFVDDNPYLVWSEYIDTAINDVVDSTIAKVTEDITEDIAIYTYSDSGETVVTENASYLAGLVIDGKGVQNGTPKPNAPVPVQVVQGTNIPYGSIGLQVGSTITPIDLQNNVLASLPDGTKDVLTIDSAGHCVLEKRTSTHVFDGSETWTPYTFANGDGFYTTVKLTDMLGSGTSMIGKALTNMLVVQGGASSMRDGGCYFDSSKQLCFINSAVTTDEEVTAWLSATNLEVLYACTPQTIDFGYINMPAIPDGASIYIIAQVTPTISVDWWSKGANEFVHALMVLHNDIENQIAYLQSEIDNLQAQIDALEPADSDSRDLPENKRALEGLPDVPVEKELKQTDENELEEVEE